MIIEATAHFSQVSQNPLSLARHPACGVQIARGGCSLLALICWIWWLLSWRFLPCSPRLARSPSYFFGLEGQCQYKKQPLGASLALCKFLLILDQASGGKLLVVTASCVTHAGLIAALLWFNSCPYPYMFCNWTVICQYYPTDHSVMMKMFFDAQYGSH